MADPTPVMSPPPPTLMKTSVTSGASSTSSRPSVPSPAIIAGWSKGCAIVAPASASSAARSIAVAMLSTNSTVPP